MLILLFFVLGLLLRTYDLNSIPLSSDSGRDLLIIYNIVQTHQLALLGPPTSLGWLYLGPFVYYLWTPFLMVSQGDPRSIVILSTALDAFVAPLIYYFGKKYIGKKASSVAAFFYMTSPLIILWSRTPLHPSLAPIFVTILLILMARWRGALTSGHIVILGLICGVLLQTHLAAAVLVLFVFIYTHRNSCKSLTSKIFLFLLPVLITLTPLLYYDVTNHFSMTLRFFLWLPYRILSSFGVADWGHAVTISSLMNTVINLVDILKLLFFPIGSVLFAIGLLAFLYGILIKSKKLPWVIRICLQTTIASVVAIIFFGSVQQHYLTFLFPIISLLIAFSISTFQKEHPRSRVLTIFLVLIGANTFNLIVSGQLVLLGRPYVLPLSVQEEIADYIDQQSKNQPFSLKPRPDIVNLPNYLDNYKYLLLWRWHKTPTENAKTIFTIYDIPKKDINFTEEDEIKLFPNSAVVTTNYEYQ
ncbi:MAG: hypothetical protein UW69_C0013G0006 [Microgenomates group bacterium GW2011_GWA2_44_7]|nr:MAG: hypothetical protein UW69_C0013G0006 [Microgenomates group bacterium GW2011_GWA2_44_7]KKT78573.1 MAG: hypothetical protein UW73_C0001G0020 [Microgenomates group bacterium GW2011_GWB1_44_8]